MRPKPQAEGTGGAGERVADILGYRPGERKGTGRS